MTVPKALDDLRDRTDLDLDEFLRTAGLGSTLDDLAAAWKAVRAPVEEVEIDEEAATVRLVIRPALAPDLTELATYLPGVDVVGAFPTDGFPSFETGLVLRLIETTIRYREPVLLQLRLVVAPADTSAWTTLDDLIGVTGLEADLSADLRGPDPALAVTVTGQADVAGGSLGASIDLPSRSFEIMLADGETMAIDELAAALLDLRAPLPNLDCDTLTITGVPDDGDYQIVAGLRTDWAIVENPALVVSQVSLDLSVEDARGPNRSTAADFRGVVQLGTSLEFEVTAEQTEDGWRFVGSLARPLTLSGVLDDVQTAFVLTDAALAPAREMLRAEVTELRLTVNAPTGDVELLVGTAMEIEGETVDVDLVIALTHGADGGYTAQLGGTLTVGEQEQVLEFGLARSEAPGPPPVTTTELEAVYRNPDLNLVETIAELSGASVDEGMDLASVELRHFGVGYRREQQGQTHPTTIVTLDADLRWAPEIVWPAVTSLIGPIEPTVDALIHLSREVSATPSARTPALTGSIWGQFNPGIEFLDAVALRLGYLLGDPTGFAIELQIGDAIFRAFRPADGGPSDGSSLTFRVAGGSLTIGDIVSYVASLLDPAIDELTFDAPWDGLTGFDLADLLDNIELTIGWGTGGTSPRSVRFSLPNLELGGPSFGLPDGLLDIDTIDIGFGTSWVEGAWKRATSMRFTGTILGKTVTPSWDPVNEAPPELPGQAPLIDLRYLAIGQHVQIQGVAEADSIAEVMGLLGGAADARRSAIAAGRPEPSDPLTAFGSESGVAFSPESQWLIALDIGLLRFIQMTVVFNDPVVYGLRLELDGEQAKNFAGLQFEILYQRINDTVGRYHTELVLPDIMRHLQLGAVSVTLPIIVVDIYTNGDFKIDLGFPWDFDFSRSAAAEVFPFVGAAGLYLAKLSALTATDSSVPTTDKGSFDPIYEFGLGIRIGLGKSFRSGPLKAEVSIAVEGIVEGVVSWFEPDQLEAGGSAVVPAGGGEVEKELFYKVAGAVSIVGRVYGEVDFAVIKVRVEVVARATIAFAVERFQPILVALTAEVSVEASVEVLFITVDFSFELTIEQRFTIDSPEPGPAPWLQA